MKQQRKPQRKPRPSRSLQIQLCACGCNKPAKPGNRFINGHQNKGKKYSQETLKKMSGEYHPNWKGGRRSNSKGYVLIKCEGYPRVDSQNYVREHILIYEQYHKCCMLKWGIVHHINEITNDNRIENLQGMTNGKHTKFHNTIDMSDRKCSQCESDKTEINKLNYRPHWKHSIINGNLLCNICYTKEYQLEHRNKRLKYLREYRLKNKEKRLEYQRKYRSLRK